MKLRKLLKAFNSYDCFTIGTEFGEGWIFYHDGESELKEITGALLERKIVNVYDREGREGDYGCITLNQGYGIIVEGYENGGI